MPLSRSRVSQRRRSQHRRPQQPHHLSAVLCLRSLVGGRIKVLHPKSVSIFLEMQVILDNNSRSDEKWGCCLVLQ
ncbi:uncharacterized protein DS421_17g582560 [Arachis hypogaea]|nr:uncharacterized protein DS421_17g582560 [Arachis hypogaea]